jgi:hypothetical protein
MFEVYVLVEKKKSSVLSFFAVFSFVMAALSVLAVVLGIYFFFPTAVFGFILGWFFNTRNYEFEYSYFDGDVRFAKIINKANRKRLPGYKMSEVVAIAPTGDASIAQYENDPQAKIRRLQSGFAGRKLYVMVARGEKGLELVYFEPDDKYLDAVCIKHGHKVRR